MAKDSLESNGNDGEERVMRFVRAAQFARARSATPADRLLEGLTSLQYSLLEAGWSEEVATEEEEEGSNPTAPAMGTFHTMQSFGQFLSVLVPLLPEEVGRVSHQTPVYMRRGEVHLYTLVVVWCGVVCGVV